MTTGNDLIDAIIACDVPTVRALLRNGADPNSIDLSPERSRWSALNFAIEYDQPEILAELLRAGADPNHQSETCWPPLLHAIDAETDFHNQARKPLDLRLIRPLVESGANPDLPWHTGYEPLAISPADVVADRRFAYKLAENYFAERPTAS